MFSSGVFVEPVSAINYYNHVKNWSFESELNLIEDEGFESGEWEQGIIYGNWSGDGNGDEALLWNVDNAVQFPHTGLWYINSPTSGENFNYTFVTPILGADFTNFLFYARGGIENEYIAYVTYSDDSYDSEDDITVGTTYELEDLLALEFINPAKYVVSFMLGSSTGSNIYFDDFYVTAYTEETGDTQDSVTARTYPWYLYDSGYATESFWTVDSDISEDEAYLGSSSYRVVEAGGWYCPPVMQTIDYLDSDDVHFADLWILNTGVDDLSIQYYVHYTDGGSSNRYMDVDSDADWQYVNFGNSFIRDGAVIDGVRIWIDEADYDESDEFYIDCVGLWADVPVTFVSFTYTISPSPIYGYAGYNVALRFGITYRYYGHLYNSSGQLEGDGIGMFGSDEGFVAFTIEDGLFNFTITARSGSSIRVENCAVTVILDDEDIERVYSLSISWYPSTTDSGGDSGVVAYDMTDLVVIIIGAFLPAGVMAGAGAKYSGGSTVLPLFMVGLTLGVGGLYLGGVVPFWYVFLTALGLVFILVVSFRNMTGGGY